MPRRPSEHKERGKFDYNCAFKYQEIWLVVKNGLKKEHPEDYQQLTVSGLYNYHTPGWGEIYGLACYTSIAKYMRNESGKERSDIFK